MLCNMFEKINAQNCTIFQTFLRKSLEGLKIGRIFAPTKKKSDRDHF